MPSVRIGSKADLTGPKSDFRCTPESELNSDIAACPIRANSGSRAHSITSPPDEHVEVTVIRAVRLAAILLPIARGLHADKGPARF